jgi:hypothetical protein
MQHCFPLLHRVVLHYKIIPAHNTWNIFAFSGAINQPEAKSYGFPLANFTSLLHSSDIRVFWLKDRKVKALQFKEGYSVFVPFFSASASLSWERTLPFLKSQTNTCIVAAIQSALSFLWVHGEFEYCSFISS